LIHIVDLEKGAEKALANFFSLRGPLAVMIQGIDRPHKPGPTVFGVQGDRLAINDNTTAVGHGFPL